VKISLWHIDFISFGCILKGRIAGFYGRFMLTSILFSITSILLFTISNSMKEILLLHIFPNISIFCSVCVCVCVCVAKIKPRTLCMLGKNSTTEPHLLKNYDRSSPMLNSFPLLNIHTDTTMALDKTWNTGCNLGRNVGIRELELVRSYCQFPDRRASNEKECYYKKISCISCTAQFWEMRCYS
jgi:hypothetical protein